jgi:CRP-like cAMP-binding protein
VIVKDRFKNLNQERILKPGDFFGELALIANNKRTASVKSLNYCNCALLSKEDFQDFCIFFPAVLNRLKKKISTYNDKLRVFQKQMLRSVDFFSRLAEPTIDELSLTMRDQFYEKDSYAFESGAPVESIIFILQGELDLVVRLDNGEEKVIDTLFQG